MLLYTHYTAEIPNSPSNVSFTAHTTTHLTLYWSPPTENSNCIAKYIVKINDWQMETTVTSLSVPNLSIGSVYNITVYGQLQDSVNRNGSTSELFVVTWKGMCIYFILQIIVIVLFLM